MTRTTSKWKVRCHVSLLVPSEDKEMARDAARAGRAVLRPERLRGKPTLLLSDKGWPSNYWAMFGRQKSS